MRIFCSLALPRGLCHVPHVNGRIQVNRKRVRSIGTLLAAGFVLLVMLRWFEYRQVYHPNRLLDGSGAGLGRPFVDVDFKALDGTPLHAWYFPGQTNSARAFGLIYCHGNGGNISHRTETCEALLETGLSVFLFDYRGYGRSAGRPSEAGTYQDAEAAHQWLLEKGFAASNLIAYGESLGGGVAAELAVRRPLAGLVLQSTFTSIPDIGAELFPWLPVRWLSRIHYHTSSKLPRLHIPVLIMHSRTDELISFKHGERNYSLANEPKLFWEIEGGHNDPLANRARYVEGINEFLRRIEHPRGQ